MAIGFKGGDAPRDRSIGHHTPYSHAVAAYTVFSNERRHAEARQGIAETGVQAYKNGEYRTAGEHFSLAAASTHNMILEAEDKPQNNRMRPDIRELMVQEMEFLTKAFVSYDRAQHFTAVAKEAAESAGMADSLKVQLRRRVLEYAGTPQLDLLNGTADHLDTRRVSADVDWLTSRIIRRFQRELAALQPPEVRNAPGVENDDYSTSVSEMLISTDSSERLSAIKSAGVYSLTEAEMRVAMNDRLPLIRIMVAREPSVPFKILVDRQRVEKDPIVLGAIIDAIGARRKGNMHRAAKKAVEEGLIRPLPVEMVRTEGLSSSVSAPMSGSIHSEKDRKRKARNARVRAQIVSKKIKPLDA